MKQEAIDNIYKAFSSVQKPKTIEFCPCCMDSDEINNLLSKKTVDLTPSDLSEYAFSALCTVGSEKDFKFFLPRIFELFYNDADWSINLEMIIKKLSLANWDSWSSNQQSAICEVVIEGYNNSISNIDPDGFLIDSWVYALAYCLENITYHLDKLFQNDKEPALQEFIETNIQVYTKGTLSNSFWENDSPNQGAIIKWLHNKKVVDYIYHKYGMVINREC